MARGSIASVVQVIQPEFEKRLTRFGFPPRLV